MRKLLSVLLCLAGAVAVWGQTRPVINVNDVLAPLQKYYGTRAEWPKAHGFKPYKRLEWDLVQRGWPEGNIPAGAYWDALQQRSRMTVRSLDEAWTNLGPYNHGGRARVIRFHPTNPAIMFAGAVSGGIFKSTDSGQSWGPLTDGLPNLSVGCFEIDATNSQVLYLGTGEGYYNGDAVLGVGLLKSTNGGTTWATTGLSYEYAAGQAITRLSLDPRNGNVLLAGTTHDLYRSVDGGASFTSVLLGDIKALVRDPQHPDTLLAALGDPWGSAQNGVYRSTNNGLTWSASSDGLPLNNFGRAVLAFAPSNPLIVYAGICGTFGANGSQMLGIYKSTDNGQSWTQASPAGTSHYASQGWYDMALAVKSDNPAMVLSAGLDVYRSGSSGASWVQKSHWYLGFGDPSYVHADHHELIFHPTHTDEVWEATDGGLFRSTDLGNTWTEMNNGFVTFQYYAMGNATLDTLASYGGTQDNGTFGYLGQPDFTKLTGGDGGYSVVDPTDDSTIYCESQNGHRYRSDDCGASFADINDGITGDGAWVTPMALDPFAPAVLYTTTTGARVWRSSNQGRPGTWQPVGQELGGDLQVLSPSTVTAGRLYAGSGGAVYRYDGSAWLNVTGNLPGTWVTRVTPDPVAANVVYVTLSGFGQGHVWRSSQGGTVWTDISGNLPNVPFQDVLVDPRDSDVLYAGGDIGVFCSIDGGTNWQIFGEGLPAARVDDMELQAQTGVLRVATHGRGLWEVSTGSPALAMLYPNGGEVLVPGNTVALRWSTGQLAGNVRVELNRSFPSAVWEALFITTANDGREEWLVGGTLSDHARFRVTHLGMGGEADTSDGDARIIVPGVRLLWPNGGETVFSGRRDTVRFARAAVTDVLRLELNRGYPDSAWTTLPGSVTGDSTAPWTVQLPAGTHARLRLTSTSHPEYTDESDGDFTLRAPAMTLEAPAGGEIVAPEVAFEIRWSAPEHAGLVGLQLNRDYPTGSWTTLTGSTANDGSYLWTPAPPAAGHCRVRLSTVYDPRTYVESAADFAIGANAVTDPLALPTQFTLHRPYPNPFNPVTTVVFELPAPARVEARVFNHLGQDVLALAGGAFGAGRHELTFDGGALPSGLYFIRVTAAGESQIVKAALLK